MAHNPPVFQRRSHQSGKGDLIMTQEKSTLPTSEHFELRELAQGVYAALATDDGAAYSNAGIIDLGEQTIVFDTFDAPQAASDLRLAAEHLTGRATSCVIISHMHADHWCGNQMFAPEVPIITTETTRLEMPDAIGWLEHLIGHPEELEESIAEAQSYLETATDPRWCASLERSIARMSLRLATLPMQQIRYPNLTFSGKLAFHGTRRVAELREVPLAHTASDAYLLLPEDRIAFIGDLGFFQCQPYMVFCDAQVWMRELEALEQLDVDTYVPGHGPLGGKVDLALQGRYIQEIETLVAGAIEDGLSLEETLERPLPAPFDGWLHVGMARWEANIHSIYNRLAG
jgi:glyoxylase-like metal-dependent hydrolase (beta-lactamase superfamily II)